MLGRGLPEEGGGCNWFRPSFHQPLSLPFWARFHLAQASLRYLAEDNFELLILLLPHMDTAKGEAVGRRSGAVGHPWGWISGRIRSLLGLPTGMPWWPHVSGLARWAESAGVALGGYTLEAHRRVLSPGSHWLSTRLYVSVTQVVGLQV